MIKRNWLPIFATIFGNMLPIIGRIFWHWDTAYFLILYWLDTAVIFFFNYLRMRKAEVPSAITGKSMTREEQLSSYRFVGSMFLVLLGAHIIFATFIVGSKVWHGGGPEVALPSFNLLNYGISFGLLLLGNVIGYWKFMRNKTYQVISIAQARGTAFARMLLIFFVLLIATFTVGPFYNISIFAIALFASLKTIGDVLEQLAEQQRSSTV
jgi:hypothetical protein